MIVQVYEIQSAAEARAMIDLGVDHIGSVLLSAEQWKVQAVKEVVETVRCAGRKSSLIPLFCDPWLIGRAIEFYQPAIVHLCEALPWQGSINPSVALALERQSTIRNAFPAIEIMRTIPIARQDGSDSALELAALFAPVSDWFLTDTVIEAGALEEQPVSGFIGITGRTCDWAAARRLVQSTHVPVILAGGIGPENAAEAIRQVRPAGVDSCTGTNASAADGRPIRFKKDFKKVAALVNSARQSMMQNSPAD